MNEEMISSFMKENRKFDPPERFSKQAAIKSMEEYKKMHEESINDPSGFWGKMASELHWFKHWDSTFHYTTPPFVKWFEGGKINMTYNCIDRHLHTWRRNKAAIIWQAENPNESRTLTFQELHHEVSKFSNVLKNMGLKKGDRVCLYMPMIPELAIAMLACARIGAIHSIVFGGFSVNALKTRIQDCEAKVVITADGSFRNGKVYPLKAQADEAIKECDSVENVVVVQRTKGEINWSEGRDKWYHELMNDPNLSSKCEAEWMDSEDSLFILYTSGTTGKPKGVLHTTGGYLTYVYTTFKYVFDMKDTDTYWCTADIGWITGHSYIVYGPLSNGATTVMFEGIPTYPRADRFWEIIEKFGVNIFYTAPTAIRALAKLGEEHPKKHDLSSLRLLGSVGEPINPEAWMWYHKVIGGERCPIVDTYWQTETGGIIVTPMPGATPLKPGSATLPFFGISPSIVNEQGEEVGPNEGGYFIIKQPWPGMFRTVWGDPDRYVKTYFEKFPGRYFAGDGAKRDDEGYFWIMGRIDDVIKVSGHRIGTAEVESALVSHDSVAEAAVVGFDHEIKGQAIYSFVTLNSGVQKSDDLMKELRKHVAKEMGPIAKPDKIQFAEALPKTRSGKIMRRILKKIAAGAEDVGDTTTLANPQVVDTLKKERV